MALAGVELETLVSETDALTTRPPPCADLAELCCKQFRSKNSYKRFAVSFNKKFFRVYARNASEASSIFDVQHTS